MSNTPLLPPSFYLRSALSVARALLGQILVHGEVGLRITEVEAYGGMEDTASHCRFGKTARNAPMWEPGGSAYVYLCYGMHHLLNLVTGPKDEPAAVLIRACEPLWGLELIEARRGHVRGPNLLTGPGKVSQALGLDLTFNFQPLFEEGGLEVREGEPPARILEGPRIGVDYADPVDRDAPLRLAIADSPWVSHRKRLNAR